MAESEPQLQEEPVCGAWQRAVQAAVAVFVILTLVLVARYHPVATPQHTDAHLQEEVNELSREVQQLKQEESMPTLVLNRYRDSICYIFGVYRVGFRGERPALRARISGTGFVVKDGLLATNRHVAEPWYGDAESTTLIHQGAQAQLEKLVAFFPGIPTPFKLTSPTLSDQADLAILHIEDSDAVRQLKSLPLADGAPTPGELVAVVGYPMGVLGMVAKSPPAVYQRLAYRRDDQGAASELAALSLIRPSATCGHMGDVVGDKLIYDAPTAHGGSGGPVFNSQGEVIGVNAAYLDGFSGGTLGVSVRALKPLIAAAEARASAN
jgi:S1-C subfamily serine protease